MGAEADKPKTVEKKEPVPATKKEAEKKEEKEEPVGLAIKKPCFNENGAPLACAEHAKCLTTKYETCPHNAEKDCTCKEGLAIKKPCFNENGAPLVCVTGAECLNSADETCADKATEDCTCKTVIAEHSYCGGGSPDKDPLKCARGFECKNLGDKDTDLKNCAKGDDEDKCACVAPVKEDGECGPLKEGTYHLECESSMKCMHVKANENDEEKPCDTNTAKALADCTCKSTAYAWWVWALIALAGLLVIALAVCVICSCAGKKNNP